MRYELTDHEWTAIKRAGAMPAECRNILLDRPLQNELELTFNPSHFFRGG